MCFREHKTFIEVHRCADDVQRAFEEFGDSLDRLLDAVPPLERECEAFAVSTRGIQQDRRKATLVLEHQDKLLDLLEIPQLVDTCVKNGYYQEAMELSAHAKSMAKRYGDVPIVLSVEAEVAKVMQLQLSQLLASLREQVKLPMLVKAVGFLRRMGDLPEDELRIAFLESRESYFRTLYGQLERDRTDKVRYTRRYIDLFRENVYDTISQYGSIFLDPQLFAQEKQPNDMDAAVDVLVVYCHHALGSLLEVISQNFPHIPDTSSLSSLLTQLGYCSLSFARVGMDFNAYIIKPFHDAVLNLTTRDLSDAQETILLAFKEATRLSRTPSAWMCSSEALPGILASPSSPPDYPEFSGSLSSPPSYLSFYPPLAIYLNAALSTLNSLRLLAPLSLMQPILTHLEQSLAGLIDELISYARAILIETSNIQVRPGAMHRNHGVRNQGVTAETRSERTREARRVLCAFAGALLHGVEEFLRRALVDGVYDGQQGLAEDLKMDVTLRQAVELLRQWIEEHGERPIELQKKADDGSSETFDVQPHLSATAGGDITESKAAAETPDITARDLDEDIDALEGVGSSGQTQMQPRASLQHTINDDDEQVRPIFINKDETNEAEDVTTIPSDISVTLAKSIKESEMKAGVDIELDAKATAHVPPEVVVPESEPDHFLDRSPTIGTVSNDAETEAEMACQTQDGFATATTERQYVTVKPEQNTEVPEVPAHENLFSHSRQGSGSSEVKESVAFDPPSIREADVTPLGLSLEDGGAVATDEAVCQPLEPAQSHTFPDQSGDESTASTQWPNAKDNTAMSVAPEENEETPTPPLTSGSSATKSTNKPKKKKKGKK